MTARIGNPFPFYFDARGLPLDGGALYVGVAGDDPEVSPVDVFADEAMTIPVTQPLSVIGGLACYDGNPTLFYTATDDYSLRARDSVGAEVLYVANVTVASTAYQPLDADLTAIAALATTAFGRSLLTQADAAAARTALGIVASLALTGGTMTGNILRGGAGAFVYAGDGSVTQMRIFVTANGAADPTSAENDIWLELAP